MEKIIEWIISALVGAVSVWIVIDFAIPQIRGLLSNSAKMHESWSYKDSENGEVVGTAKIKQFGNKVVITAMRTIDREGNNTSREFVYTGTISDRTLVLQYEQKNSGNSVGGSIVLRLNADLKSMKGITSYFSDSVGAVISFPIFYYTA